MRVITSIEPQQHDPERVNVYLDGEFSFGAATMLVFARGLRPGSELDDEIIAEILRDDTVEKVYGAALNFLSYRPRSRRELEDYFRRKGTEPQVGKAVVERLLRAGILDDREFARYWVENRLTFRPRGSRALRVEMRRKGLDSEIIDEALDGAMDEDVAAYEAGRAKLRSLQNLDEREFLRKMVGFLQRRGFSYGVSSNAARRLRTSESPEDVLSADADPS